MSNSGVQRLALAGHHGHMPGDIGMGLAHLLALVHAAVAGVGKNVHFLTMQQSTGLRHIMHVGRRAHHRAHLIGVRSSPIAFVPVVSESNAPLWNPAGLTSGQSLTH